MESDVQWRTPGDDPWPVVHAERAALADDLAAC
jgi:hypothetical protein